MRTQTTTILSLLLTTLVGSALGAGPARADDPKARDVIRKSRYRDDGNNGSSSVTMILIDDDDKREVRSLKVMKKDFGKDVYQVMFFTDPPDLKNTGFLTLDYDSASKEDDQWLYLPALRKSKRIASSDKSSSFLGSDFTFADLSSMNVDDYDYKLVGESKVDASKVWVIEAKPRSKQVIARTGVKQSLHMVRQDNYVKVREVQWMRTGEMKYWEGKNLQTIDHIVVPTEQTMTTKKNDKVVHRTIIKVTNIKFNQQFSDSLFSVSRLEKGL